MEFSQIVRKAIFVLLACMPLTALAADSGVGAPVVSQGGVTVTIGDVDAYMQRIPADKWAGFVSNADRIESMLKDILRTKMLAAQAVEMKLDKTVSAQSQLQLAHDDVLARLRMIEFNDSIKVPDLNQLAKERYIANKDRYVIPAEVTVQHILISKNGRSDAAALALAEQVREKAIAHPEQYDALVMQYSDDPSKDANKGVMKDANSDKFVPEFAKAAGTLTAANPISPPVKTKFGYHILKLVSTTPAQQQSFDEVKLGIIEELKKNYISEQKQVFLSNLAAQEMTPYPDAIAALHGRYFTGTGLPVENPQPQPQPQPIPPAQNTPTTGEH